MRVSPVWAMPGSPIGPGPGSKGYRSGLGLGFGLRAGPCRALHNNNNSNHVVPDFFKTNTTILFLPI